MKRFIWALGGVCAAAAGLLVWGQKRRPNVEELAQDFEDDEWADRHTSV